MIRLEFGKTMNKDDFIDSKRFENTNENNILDEDYENNQIRNSNYDKMKEIDEMKEFEMIENDILRNEIAPEIEEDFVPVIFHKAQKRNSNSTYSSIITTSTTTSTSTPTPLCLDVYPQRANNIPHPQRFNNDTHPQRINNDTHPQRVNNITHPQRVNNEPHPHGTNKSQSRENIQPSVSARELLMQQRKSGSIDRVISTTTLPLSSDVRNRKISVDNDNNSNNDNNNNDNYDYSDNNYNNDNYKDGDDDDDNGCGDDGEIEDKAHIVAEEESDEDRMKGEGERGGGEVVEEEMEDILGDSLTSNSNLRQHQPPSKISIQGPHTQQGYTYSNFIDKKTNRENNFADDVQNNISRMSVQSSKMELSKKRIIKNSPPQSRLKKLIMENDRDNFDLLEETVEIASNIRNGNQIFNSENKPIKIITKSVPSASNLSNSPVVVGVQNKSENSVILKLNNGSDPTQKNKYQSNLSQPLRKDRGQVITSGLGLIDSMLDSQNRKSHSEKENDEQLRLQHQHQHQHQLQLELSYDLSREIKQNYPPSIHDLLALCPPIMNDNLKVTNTHERYTKRTYDQDKVKENIGSKIDENWIENIPKRNEMIEEVKDEDEKVRRDKRNGRAHRQESESLMGDVEDNYISNHQLQQSNKQNLDIKNKPIDLEHNTQAEKKRNKIRDEIDEENILLAEILALEQRQQRSYRGPLKNSDPSSASTPTSSIPKKTKLKVLKVQVEREVEDEDEGMDVTEGGGEGDGEIRGIRNKTKNKKTLRRSVSTTRTIRSEGEVKESRAFGPGARDIRKNSLMSPGKPDMNSVIRSRSNSVLRATPTPSPRAATATAAAAAATLLSTAATTVTTLGLNTAVVSPASVSPGILTAATTARTVSSAEAGVSVGVTDRESTNSSLRPHRRASHSHSQPQPQPKSKQLSKVWSNNKKCFDNQIEVELEEETKILSNGDASNYSITSTLPSNRMKKIELKSEAKDKDKKEQKENEKGKGSVLLYDVGVHSGAAGGGGGGGGGEGEGGGLGVGGGYLMEYKRKIVDKTRDNSISRRHSDRNPIREIHREDGTDYGARSLGPVKPSMIMKSREIKGDDCNISLPSISFKSRQILDTTHIFSDKKNYRQGGAVSAPSRLRNESDAGFNNDNSYEFETEIEIENENEDENEYRSKSICKNKNENEIKHEVAKSLLLPAPVRMSHDYGSGSNLLRSNLLRSKVKYQIR